MAQGISVVTTCYNERENLPRLISAVRTVLHSIQHEIIVVDDTSPDGSVEVARQLADVAFSKKREGQTMGLAAGMRTAKYETIVTIDSDLENDPKWIPILVSKLMGFDIVVASRPKLPRVSEKLFSKVYSKKLGVGDILCNYRAYRKEIIPLITPTKGETFGAEFLIRAQKPRLRITEIIVEDVPRRMRARIGNTITANLRIFAALTRTILI